MTNRDKKILVYLFCGLVGAFVLYFIVDSMLLSKARDANLQAKRLADEIVEKEIEKRAADNLAARLEKLSRKTFGGDQHKVGTDVQHRLVELLEQYGLGIELTPVASRGGRKNFKEVGYTVKATGRMQDLIHFVSALNAEPYLHKVDSIALTPKHKEGLVEMTLRFVTLKIEPAGKAALPTRDFELKSDPAAIRAASETAYAAITTRDLFRPYIQKPPPKPPEPEPRPKPPEPKPPPPPPPGPPVRVVSLTTWAGNQEIHVRGMSSMTVTKYLIGDELGGGKVVMIDYRVMPISKDTPELSGSRVIILKGKDYYAVDLGKTTAEARKLTPSELPDNLR